jgi:hypothetical protein
MLIHIRKNYIKVYNIGGKRCRRNCTAGETQGNIGSDNSHGFDI